MGHVITAGSTKGKCPGEGANVVHSNGQPVPVQRQG